MSAANHCPQCGCALRNAVFCPECGQMFCSWKCYQKHGREHRNAGPSPRDDGTPDSATVGLQSGDGDPAT